MHVSMSIYGQFQGVHGSQEPGCDKRGVNDTDIDRYIDTIILCVGAVAMINVGLAQAHPNNKKIFEALKCCA